VVHADPEYLRIPSGSDYSPQYEVEPVKVSTQEEICRRAEFKVFGVEEPAS